MDTHIKHLEISNFKSVRKLSLDCERINVFIGKPNAGKSNILEAISLLGAGYSTQKFMDGLVRYKSLRQLFNDFNTRNDIEVTSNMMQAVLREFTDGVETFFHFSTVGRTQTSNINDFFLLKTSGDFVQNERIIATNIKKYEFKFLERFSERGNFLYPPHGDNFYSIVRGYPELREEIQRFLAPNGLELLLDEESQDLKVVRKSNGTLLSFPLHLVPDTFQRYIFHLAAIMSNRDSVLLFEEPETHSYAPYVYQLAQQINDDPNNNQYFLTTHNPYLLTPLMQEAKDVAVFVTWFENYETRARRLSEEEIREMLDFGVDIFLNLDQFIPA
jgi:hypothetical protein